MTTDTSKCATCGEPKADDGHCPACREAVQRAIASIDAQGSPVTTDTLAGLLAALKPWADSRRFADPKALAKNTRDLLVAYDAYVADQQPQADHDSDLIAELGKAGGQILYDLATLRAEVQRIADQARYSADVWEPTEDPSRRFLRAIERDLRAALAGSTTSPRADEEESGA